MRSASRVHHGEGQRMLGQHSGSADETRLRPPAAGARALLLIAGLALLLGGCERPSPAPAPAADAASTAADRLRAAECEVISALVQFEFERGTGYEADTTAHYGWRGTEARSILPWNKLSPCGADIADIMTDAAADCVNEDWHLTPAGWLGVPESLVVDLELWSQAVIVGRDVGPVACLFEDPAIVVASGATMYGSGPLPGAPTGWEGILERYPGLTSIVYVTRPAISKAGRQAVALFGWNTPWGREGGWFKLVRLDGAWQPMAFSKTYGQWF